MSNVTFKTRISKTSEPVSTTAEIDFTGVTEEQLHELATRSVVIAIQATYRTAEVVPSTDKVVVAELLKREHKTKATPESLAKKVNSMSEADKAALLKLLTESVNRS